MITDRRCTANDCGDSIWYEAAMISTFPGVFDDCDNNYEVEQRLRKAGVIKAQNQTDSETCALVVNFSSQKSANAFGERLEAYIQAHTAERV